MHRHWLCCIIHAAPIKDAARPLGQKYPSGRTKALHKQFVHGSLAWIR